LIEQPDHDDVSRSAGLIGEIVLEVAVRIDRIAHADIAERRKGLHVDKNAILAIEQPEDFRAYRVLECGLVEALGLRLAGHDQPGGVGGGGLQGLAGEEDHRRLHDGKDQGKKRRRHQPELDRCGAILLLDETTHRADR
jgi:hypothetical protein